MSATKSQIHSQSPEDPPSRDTDTTGQSGRSNTTQDEFRLDDWRVGLHRQDLKPKPKNSATNALYQPLLKHF